MIPLNNIPVSHLRKLIAVRQLGTVVDKSPGIYVWWFKEEAAWQLLKPLEPVDHSRLARRTINGEPCVALYFGISRDLRSRIRWHVAQKHTPSAISKGFLSTLRLTICALLGLPASVAEQAVNDFMDANCYISFAHMLMLAETEAKEADELSTNYYPLNLQGNKVVEAAVLAKLKALRKTYRK